MTTSIEWLTMKNPIKEYVSAFMFVLGFLWPVSTKEVTSK